MATIQTKAPPGLPKYDAPTVVIESADSLDSDAENPIAWTVEPNIYLDSLQLVANGVSKATLSATAGRHKRLGGDAFVDQPLYGLSGKFLRITITAHAPVTGDFTPTETIGPWVGYVEQDRYTRGDSTTQTFVAYGLEWFLGRNKIYDAVYWREDLGLGSELRLQRPAVFNGGADRTVAGKRGSRANRHPLIKRFDNAADELNVGAGDPVLWSAGDIAEYLLAHHAPAKWTGDDQATGDPSPCEFVLVNAAAGDGIRPTVKLRGRTVLEILGDAANPRRGVGWYAAWDDANDRVEIRLFAYRDAAVVLPGGETAPANPAVNTLMIDDDPKVDRLDIVRSRKRRYNRVRVIGARMTSTFTLSVEDGTLIKAWTDAEEAAYLAAGDEARRDREHARVFREFAAAGWGWDGSTGDGSSGFSRESAFPVLSPTGSVVGSHNVYPSGMRMLRTTRLQSGGDDSTVDEYDPPRLYVQRGSDWVYGDDVNGEGGGSLASYTIQTGQADGVGVRMTVGSNKGVAHTLALNHFDAAAATETPPEIDYETLRVTLTAEADAHAEGVYTTAAVGETVEELTIDAGDDYRLDFLAKGTITGIDAATGDLQTESAASVLRDDRRKLQNLAVMASDYYRLAPAQATVSWRRVWGGLRIGSILTAIGEGIGADAINEPVVRMEWDLRRHTTEIGTAGPATQKVRSQLG